MLHMTATAAIENGYRKHNKISILLEHSNAWYDRALTCKILSNEEELVLHKPQ